MQLQLMQLFVIFHYSCSLQKHGYDSVVSYARLGSQNRVQNRIVEESILFMTLRDRLRTEHHQTFLEIDTFRTFETVIKKQEAVLEKSGEKTLE